jgi:hypothetical protein
VIPILETIILSQLETANKGFIKNKANSCKSMSEMNFCKRFIELILVSDLKKANEKAQ